MPSLYFVIDGNLLNYNEDTRAFYATRDELKQDFIRWLFAGNHCSNLAKRTFKEQFPDVYFLFNHIKKHEKNRLSLLLQSIESTVFLLLITKRFSKLMPKLPIFSIHDGIATTDDGLTVLEEIMREELTNCAGVPPSLKVENWNPDLARINTAC
jgi:hypothetical protein